MSTENTITLNGSELTWQLVNSFESKCQYWEIPDYGDTDGDDEELITAYSKGEVFYNKDRNICIVFEQFRRKNIPFLENTSEITTHTENNRYNDLLTYIKTHKDVTIYWAQFNNSNAYYTIIENLPFDKINIDGKNNSALIDPKALRSLGAGNINNMFEVMRILPKEV